MLTPRRRLLKSCLAFLALFALANALVRAYERHRFIPFQRVGRAIAAGDGCTAFSGASDMLTALDLPTIAGNWGSGPPPCLADLSIGGGSPDVRFMAFREYARVRHPAALVIGFKGHDIVDSQPYTPGYYVGNDAAVYEWGTLADLKTYYPRVSFAAFDNGLRFLLFRAFALGAYRQSLWLKVEALEERLGLLPKKVTNALGNVDAFLELEADARDRALATQHTWERDSRGLATWHGDLVRAAGSARVSFVKLPARASVEQAYFADPASEARFDEFMRRLAAEHGGKFIDLSHAPWVEDSLLIDGLHYNARGRELISKELGRALGSAAGAQRP